MGLNLLAYSFLFIVGFIIFVVIKQTKEKEKKRQERLSAIEEQKKLEVENDKKHDLIINCPRCNGTGRCIREKFYSYRLKVSDEYVKYHTPDYGDHENEEYSDGIVRYKFIECPFCKGEGIAYAYFEESKEKYSSTCPTCKGAKNVEKRVKEDIGVGKLQVVCPNCNGLGTINRKMYTKIAHIQTLHSVYAKYDKFYTVNITNDNRSFFSKSKPRFDAPSESNKEP